MFSCNLLSKNKELFIALYFFLFSFGLSVGISSNFYNEFRVMEVILLLFLIALSFFQNKNIIFFRLEALYIIFIFIGYFYWSNYWYIFFELLLFYLLFRSVFIINYSDIVTRVIVFSGFFGFLLLPVSLYEYVNIGVYKNWYLLPWNIRVYNSYYLILSFFSIYLYLNGGKYKAIYLLFNSFAFLSFLLDGARSAILAYSVFILCISFGNRLLGFKLIFTYFVTWLIYFSILNLSDNSAQNFSSIARKTTSNRYELWYNAFECWSKNPFLGCGFYQIDHYKEFAAHPHNIFIQILTETGILGLFFLSLISIKIIKKINFSFKENYFALAIVFSIIVDLSLSGVHVYPVTQILLLWLCVFLLKDVDFKSDPPIGEYGVQLIALLIYFLMIVAFLFLLINTSALSGGSLLAPPRFWEYGYQLF